ncbi:hypothetical protein [Parasutterella sp.]|uniref:hypothetical protein n=1 Tax=Parasutterella sp. TaxID=2049037 RepID=UPI003AF95C0C
MKTLKPEFVNALGNFIASRSSEDPLELVHQTANRYRARMAGQHENRYGLLCSLSGPCRSESLYRRLHA